MADQHAKLQKVGEAIDNLCTIEITGRGVVRDLYAAVRAKQPGPLCLTVAQELAERLQPGDVVVIATGLPTYPWFSGEQDGPVGAATLARALVLGLGARPVVMTEAIHVEMCRASVRGAGLYARGLDEALRLPTTAALVAFPTDPAEAKREAEVLLERLKPKAMIAIERPGANEHGHYHGAKGFRLTDHCAKLDVLFEHAKARGIYTVGIGAGGNELGCALIHDTVVATVPYAATCQCACHGSVVPVFVPHHLIIAAISNWGAYGVAAALALLLDRREVLHDRGLDRRVHELCAAAGANNDGPGLLDPGTDAVPADIHGDFVELLGFMVGSGIDFGRLYKEPRYPWLAV
ncbi:MAG TPA: glutamate cyclase domain-containing protein [bacterium]|nr:glutamate cyclase domain-containing protein [bacterium]